MGVWVLIFQCFFKCRTSSPRKTSDLRYVKNWSLTYVWTVFVPFVRCWLDHCVTAVCTLSIGFNSVWRGICKCNEHMPLRAVLLSTYFMTYVLDLWVGRIVKCSSFTHHFFLFWFTTLLIYNSIALSLPA